MRPTAYRKSSAESNDWKTDSRASMTSGLNSHRKWLLPTFVVVAVFRFVATVGFGLFLSAQARAKEQASRRRETAALKRNDVQLRYASYILCRSEGRTQEECRKIAEGIRLPPNLTLQELEARLAKISSARITKLVIGPPGKTVTIGAPKAGAAGRRGPRGARGAAGFRG